jgi:hypothetical protein
MIFKVILLVWIILVIYGTWHCATYRSRFKKPVPLPELFTLIILVAIPLFFGGLFWLITAQVRLAVDRQIQTGSLLETHSFPDKPAMEIRMHGFQDASFDAYIIEANSKRKLFTSLTCLRSTFNGTTNAHPQKYVGIWHPAKGSPQMYEVFWSQDSQRVAVAFQGYFIAAYDRVSEQKIELGDALRLGYEECDRLINSFLETGPTKKRK